MYLYYKESSISIKKKKCTTKNFGIQTNQKYVSSDPLAIRIIIEMITFSEVKLRIKAKNVDIDANHFQQVTLNGFDILF